MLRLVAVLPLLFSLLPTSAYSQISFTDVTPGSNITYVGESYGASWGYANDDLLPDLFVSHHRDDAGLYMNLGNGTFENRAFEIDVFQSVPRADQHGGAFGDYNNDGFSDLLITAGAANNSQFLVNNGFFMSDQVSNFTFDVKNWGGRMPAWFDFTNDGLLDLAVGASGGQAKFQTHEQVGGDFLKRNFHTGQNCVNNNYGQLSDLNNDGTLEWICSRHDFHPDKIYDYSSGLPWVDRTNIMPTTTSVVDSQFADFNGDLLMDMFAIRGRARVSGSEQTGNKTVETHLINFNGDATGLTFKTSGDVSFVLHTRERNAAHVYIGASGMNAPYPGPKTPISFTLSPTDPNVVGLVPDFSSVPSDIGVFIGYNPNTQTWTFLDWSDDSSVLSYTYGYISSTTNITNLTQENLHTLDLPKPPTLLRQTGSGFVDGTAAANLATPIGCVSVATADFDNDMDLDLYIACRNAVSNAANMVLENDGSGNFSVVANAGGAAGPIGFGVGLSETVVVSDYDVDGFVDVFVTNGLKLYPELIGYTDGGPDKLFKNNGNSNHWLELDLIGTSSNADGIGAIVTVTAGGVMQRREQNGGYHRWAQDDTRLHFGLAGNTTANIEVRWPSGLVNTYNNVSADGLYEVVEQGGITKQTDLSAIEPPECQSTVGEPIYDVAVDREMFIWRDGCQSNTWKVRVTGGTGPQITYSGAVDAAQPFANVVPVGLEFPWDVLDYTSNPSIIDYSLIVGDARRDGFDFTVATGTTACFGVGSNIAVAYAGAGRLPINLPFDLATGGACGGGGGGFLPSLSIADASAGEDTGTISFTVSLSYAATGNVNFTATTANGSATVADGDYTALANAAGTIIEGQLSTTVTVALGSDNTFEPDENFTVTLALSGSNAVLGDASATGTIVNDDAVPPTISIQDGSASENDGSGQIRFRVELDAPHSQNVRVKYTTQNGSASAPEDYVSKSGSLSITSGSTSRIIFITLVDDLLEESSETFSVVLSDPENVILGDAVGVGTILDDDGPPSLTISDVSANEDSGTLDFVVSIHQTDPSNVTFNATTSDGTATTSDNDYTPLNAQAGMIPAGQLSTTVSVAMTPDAIGESNETFTVSLSSVSANVTVVDGQATGTILDDDGPAVVPLTSWTGHLGGVSTAGNQISYSGSPTEWANNTVNSVPLSSLGFSSDYEVSWTLNSNPNGTNWVVGLGITESDPGRTDIDYGLRSVNGNLQIRENGAWRNNGPSLSQGDVISILVRAGGTIESRHNGNLIYTSTYSGSPNFYVDSSFKAGAVAMSVEVAGLDTGGPTGPFTAITDWIDQSGGVSSNSNDISFSGSPTGWNNNTINSVSLSESGITDDYVVSWRIASASNGNWIVGLGTNDTGADWRDVDYGWRTVDGSLRIFENGVYRSGTGSSASPGDILAIRVSGTSLEYLLNGTPVYNSVISGSEDFYIDSSFKNGAVNLADFEIAEL